MSGPSTMHLASGEADLDDARKAGIVIMGAGLLAGALHNACTQLGITVHAFVVSNSTATRHRGLPLYSLATVPDELRGMALWLGIFNHHDNADLVKLRQQCRAHGFVNVFLPQHYYALVQAQLGWCYWLAPLAAYSGQEENIQTARALLADDESRRIYDAILLFRQAKTLETPIPRSPGPQYFPADLIHRLPRNTRGYIDGGAYDGDTVMLAMKHLAPELVLAFEPDPANYRKLVANTATAGTRAILFPLGISDGLRFLRFHSGNNAGSAIDGAGDSQVQVIDLDSAVSCMPIDFLKLDIEGCEVEALHGARKLISAQQPFLAIAGYHRWDDLWKIPMLIHALNPGYRIDLRLHCANSFDAVFYASRA